MLSEKFKTGNERGSRLWHSSVHNVCWISHFYHNKTHCWTCNELLGQSVQSSSFTTFSKIIFLADGLRFQIRLILSFMDAASVTNCLLSRQNSFSVSSFHTRLTRHEGNQRVKWSESKMCFFMKIAVSLAWTFEAAWETQSTPHLTLSDLSPITDMFLNSNTAATRLMQLISMLTVGLFITGSPWSIWTYSVISNRLMWFLILYNSPTSVRGSR